MKTFLKGALKNCHPKGTRSVAYNAGSTESSTSRLQLQPEGCWSRKERHSWSGNHQAARAFFRNTLKLLALNLTVLGVCLFLDCSGQTTLTAENLGHIRSEMLIWNDSLDKLNYIIHDIMQDEAASDSLQDRLNALINTQEEIWHRYAELRKKIAYGKRSALVTALKQIGGFLMQFRRAAVLGAIVLLFLFWIVYIKRRRSKANLIKQPSKPRRRLDSPGFKEIRARRYANNSAEAQIKKAIKGLAQISEQSLKKSSEPPRRINPEITEKPSSKSTEEVINGVSHLDEKETDENFSIQSNPENNTAVTLQENPLKGKNATQEEVRFFKQAEKKLIDGTNGWAVYENEQNKKANILKLARKGRTSSEISKRLRISQDEVELIIRANQN